jgi:hypothetical protein
MGRLNQYQACRDLRLLKEFSIFLQLPDFGGVFDPHTKRKEEGA